MERRAKQRLSYLGFRFSYSCVAAVSPPFISAVVPLLVSITRRIVKMFDNFRFSFRLCKSCRYDIFRVRRVKLSQFESFSLIRCRLSASQNAETLRCSLKVRRKRLFLLPNVRRFASPKEETHAQLLDNIL